MLSIVDFVLQLSRQFFAKLQDKTPNRKAGFEAVEGKHLRLAGCLRTGVF